MPQCAWLWIIICIELWKIHADKCMCCILFATCASDTWQMLICFLLVLFFIKVEFAKDSVETKLYTCMKMKITVSKIRWNYICRPGLTVIVIRLSFKEAKPYCFTNLLFVSFPAGHHMLSSLSWWGETSHSVHIDKSMTSIDF